MYCDQQNSSVVQWQVLNGGLTYQACGQTALKLPAGAYTPTVDCYGNRHFHPRDLKVDDLIDFVGSLPSRILHEVDAFWALGPRFKQYGFLHRRGYLLYGKHGGGKSSLIHQVIASVVAGGHVAFFCENPHSFVSCLEQFRQVERDRPIVCVFEDIDAIIHHYGDAILLQWLDGNHQVDRAVNIASTNYPEKLDPRIVSRPRRFDRILRIEAPVAEMREAYFARKMPEMPRAELAVWVGLTEGLQCAALAELVISVKCLGNGLEETVERLRRIDGHQPSSGEFEEGPNGESNGLVEERQEAGVE